MPTPAELLAEIQSGPLAAELAALPAGDDAGRAAVLNRRDRPGPVPIRELASYCINSGITGTVLAMVEIPIGQDGMTLPLKGLLHTVRTLIQADFRLESAEVTGAVFAAACDGLIAAGVITAQQKTEMIALGDDRLSRAEELWGSPVTERMVGDARNG